MSNEPINGNAPAQPPPGVEQLEPTSGIRIARIPITLGEGQSTFQIEIRGPGLVRAASFWIHEPKVLASAMRGVQKIPMPLLFVECNLASELRKRTFSFVPSGATIDPKPGFEARYAATAIMQLENGLLTAHLFELVEVPS